MTTATIDGLLAQGADLSKPSDFVNGELVDSLETSTTPVLDPATGREIGVSSVGSAAGVDRAVQAAKAALPGWRRTVPKRRAEILNELADRLEANADLFIDLEALNAGKPHMIAREEIPAAVDSIRFLAGAARVPEAPAPGEYLEGHLSYIQREPMGVCAAVTPWNYPLMMAVWKLAPALATGNTVVLKPSELTPLTTLSFAKLSQDILPPGVLNIVTGNGLTVGTALVEHPDVAMISLTGSIRAGRAVAEGAGRHLKRVHLELGGKAPFIVAADADLDAAVEAVRTVGYWNAGQECGAACRVLVDEQIRNEFAERLEAAVGSIVVGGFEDGRDVEMGPLITAEAQKRVEQFVQQSRSEGARTVVGGNRVDRDGFYFEPTVITDVDQNSRIIQEEVFGPVVTVQSYDTFEQALDWANGVDFGLAASVWTRDLSRGLAASRELNFGTVWVNDHLAMASEMPWVGFGSSGMGRDMSRYVLDDYTRTKHVMITH